MAMKKRNPRTPGSRFQTYVSNDAITKKSPERSLTKGLKKTGGRNAYGRITVRHRGGGATRKYRIIDFSRAQRNVPGTIKSVEYDPNRNAHIALVVYQNGAKGYILMPADLSVGSVVYAGVDAEARVGNCTPLAHIPVGFNVHNIEIKPGSGGKLVRSAGASAQLVAKKDNYATLKMPSGEMRMLHLQCWATIGVLGNAEYKNISWGKAGRTRHRGIRPTVRGIVMNPVDHPRGGGEGLSKSGSFAGLSPWGKNTTGTRTRRRKNPLILKRRK
jgi:large subunit ribosomal protein L2